MTRIAILPKLSIEEDDLVFRFVSASGPGGQNVNKVATAVELRFDTARLGETPPGYMSRLAKLAGQRMTREGVIVLFAQTHRSQLRNREDALARLVELLAKAGEVRAKRRPTKPTRGSRERRLQGKAARSGVKKMRGRPVDA
jgi:ribosome-associated protein